MKGYADFINYFQLLASGHQDIVDFQYGDSEKILTSEVSNMSFPTFWLETPDVRLSDRNADPHMVFSSSFVIMDSCPADEWTEQMTKFDKTYRLAQDFVLKILKDSDSLEFNFDRDQVEMYPIFNKQSSPVVGWRVEFRVDIYPDGCDLSKFELNCPIGAIAKFKWTNQSTDEFDVTFENHSFPSSGWTVEMNYYVDDEPVQTTASFPSSNFVDTGNQLYVEMKLSNENGCDLLASAVIFPQQTSGWSLPFKVIE